MERWVRQTIPTNLQDTEPVGMRMIRFLIQFLILQQMAGEEKRARLTPAICARHGLNTVRKHARGSFFTASNELWKDCSHVDDAMLNVLGDRCSVHTCSERTFPPQVRQTRRRNGSRMWIWVLVLSLCLDQAHRKV